MHECSIDIYLCIIRSLTVFVDASFSSSKCFTQSMLQQGLFIAFLSDFRRVILRKIFQSFSDHNFLSLMLNWHSHAHTGKELIRKLRTK